MDQGDIQNYIQHNRTKVSIYDYNRGDFQVMETLVDFQGTCLHNQGELAAL